MAIGNVAITIKAVDKASSVLWHLSFLACDFKEMMMGQLVAPAGRSLAEEQVE